jgi:hypothetical protein
MRNLALAAAWQSWMEFMEERNEVRVSDVIAVM